MTWPFPDEPDPQGWDYSINGEWPFGDEGQGRDSYEEVDHD